MNINAIIRAVKKSDLIITPVLTPWLAKHGDEPFPDWVVDRLVEILRAKPRDRSGSFSGSAAGSCFRAQELQFAGVPGAPVDAQLQNIFNDGKYRHLRWQGMLLTTGLATDIEYLVKWPKMLSRGSLDARGVVPDNHAQVRWRGLEYGVEVKGVSTFQFSELKKNGMLHKHKKQVHHYFVLGCFDLFIVIYEDKTTQDFHEWVVEPEQALLEEAEKEIWELRNAVRTGQMHPMLPGCRRHDAVWKECGYGENGRCEKALRKPPKPFLIGV